MLFHPWLHTLKTDIIWGRKSITNSTWKRHLLWMIFSLEMSIIENDKLMLFAQTIVVMCSDTILLSFHGYNWVSSGVARTLFRKFFEWIFCENFSIWLVDMWWKDYPTSFASSQPHIPLCRRLCVLLRASK